MAQAAESAELSGRRSLVGRMIGGISSSAFAMVAAYIVLIWVIEVVDTFLLGSNLQRGGILPRQREGLDGILWAPFLHSDWGHVLSNTAPLAFLGGLVGLRGRARWLTTTAVAIVVGGGLTWLLGGSGNHIGASGVIFGYFGALLGAGLFFERKPITIAPALVAIFLYYGLIVGLVPQDGISWEGHLFGMIGGLLASKLLVGPKPDPVDDNDVDLSAFPPDFDFGTAPE